MSDEKPHQFRPPLYHQDGSGTDAKRASNGVVRAARMGRVSKMAVSREHETKLDRTRAARPFDLQLARLPHLGRQSSPDLEAGKLTAVRRDCRSNFGDGKVVDYPVTTPH